LNSIEGHTTGLMSYMLMDFIGTMVLKGDTIRNWFTGRLNRKWNLAVSKVQSLPVNSTNRYSKVFRVSFSELRDVVGILSRVIFLTLQVKLGNFCLELGELGNDKIFRESLLNNSKGFLDDFIELLLS
jgi:hypothetical protein